ncbi:hypothetical protein [Thermococcus sp.]|uniref:hypothetical protein n=1 Tax=Thermococcus sp. TaxID=35749 RepID=UPI00345819E1
MVKVVSPSFSRVNLKDIASPKFFYLLERPSRILVTASPIALTRASTSDDIYLLKVGFEIKKFDVRV